MKETHAEGLANHSDRESCAGSRKGAREALTVARTGRILSLENSREWSADAVLLSGRQHPMHRQCKMQRGSAWSEIPDMYGNSMHRNWEIPCLAEANSMTVRVGNPEGVHRR